MEDEEDEDLEETEDTDLVEEIDEDDAEEEAIETPELIEEPSEDKEELAPSAFRRLIEEEMEKGSEKTEEEAQEEGGSLEAKRVFPAASFKSKVTVENNVVHIEIHEFYVEGFYPKDQIEELQNVVNAAYEFYIAKIKLVEI